MLGRNGRPSLSYWQWAIPRGTRVASAQELGPDLLKPTAGGCQLATPGAAGCEFFPEGALSDVSLCLSQDSKGE